MNTAAARRAYTGPAFFSIGLRPFFLLSALWSALAVPVWIHAYVVGGTVGLSWHVHEMLFGYGGGVIVGFLMTAVPNWTGRMPVIGLPLMAMVGLWLAGRLAMAVAAFNPGLAATGGPATIDALLLVVMAGLVWREILVGRNWRNLPVAVMISLLALANIGFHVEVFQTGLAPLATRAALALIIMLIALIGGRITPSFTRNWQVKRGGPLPASAGRFDMGILIVTGLALAAWVIGPSSPLTGAGLVLASALNLIRLVRWRGDATTTEPLVLILHIGYLWLVIGLGLVGAAVLAPTTVTPSAGIHALTAGAVGVMTLAVMTRASRGHTGRALTAGPAGVLVYILINAAALTRVAGSLWVSLYQPLLIISAALWCLAFLTFALAYGPMLVGPRAKVANQA